MSLFSAAEAKLPAGFRFHPRDEELISDYLARKVSGDCSGYPSMMIDVDLNKCEPWDLPDGMCGRKDVVFLQRPQPEICIWDADKPSNTLRLLEGHWEGPASHRPPARRGALVGMRKTLVFHMRKGTKGRKTDWVMHEFRIQRSSSQANPRFSFKEDWVLCRVFHKSRGLPIKTNADSHDDTGHSSVPLLSDAMINFKQAQVSDNGYKQLPYFSNCLALLDCQPQDAMITFKQAQDSDDGYQQLPYFSSYLALPNWQQLQSSSISRLSHLPSRRKHARGSKQHHPSEWDVGHGFISKPIGQWEDGHRGSF